MTHDGTEMEKFVEQMDPISDGGLGGGGGVRKRLQSNSEITWKKKQNAQGSSFELFWKVWPDSRFSITGVHQWDFTFRSPLSDAAILLVIITLI